MNEQVWQTLQDEGEVTVEVTLAEFDRMIQALNAAQLAFQFSGQSTDTNTLICTVTLKDDEE
ncbi:MAG TPA: hypothetical protein VFU72_03060 [Nitrolancea sp.]|nr:hypothetical protein [Nitrolancea sp.]